MSYPTSDERYGEPVPWTPLDEAEVIKRVQSNLPGALRDPDERRHRADEALAREMYPSLIEQGKSRISRLSQARLLRAQAAEAQREAQDAGRVYRMEASAAMDSDPIVRVDSLETWERAVARHSKLNTELLELLEGK